MYRQYTTYIKTRCNNYSYVIFVIFVLLGYIRFGRKRPSSGHIGTTNKVQLKRRSIGSSFVRINPLRPNDAYKGRTAPLTSKRCILYIYSTNIGTEYF